MKKFLSFLAMAAVVLLSGCAKREPPVDYSGLEFVDRSEMAFIMGYDNLAELEEESDLIVVGTFKGNARQELDMRFDADFNKEVFYNVTSYNTFKISKVFKGDVKVGDKIEVAQHYGVYEDKFYTRGGLTPMLDGDTWMLFLVKNPEKFGDSYSCAGDTCGRYPVPGVVNEGAIPFSADMEKGVYDPYDFQDEIYDEILEKYEF